MRYRFYIALVNDWKEVSRTEYNSFKGRKLRAPFYCTQEQLDELWKHKLEEKKQKRKKKQYYISGMSLVNGSWQSCGWTVEATSFTEAAQIVEADKTFRVHSISNNAVY